MSKHLKKIIKKFIGDTLFQKHKDYIEYNVEDWAKKEKEEGYVDIELDLYDFELNMQVDSYTSNKPTINEKNIEIKKFDDEADEYVSSTLKEFKNYVKLFELPSNIETQINLQEKHWNGIKLDEDGLNNELDNLISEVDGLEEEMISTVPLDKDIKNLHKYNFFGYDIFVRITDSKN